MPSGDRTGPSGRGSRTGRAAGYCAGFEVPGFMNPGGRGFGRGLGRGFGMRYGRFVGWGGMAPMIAPVEPFTNENEAQLLEQQIENLTVSLESMKKRLAELEKKPKKD